MDDLGTGDIKHTVLQFEQGETASDWDLEEKIFQGDHSHKCPTYIHKTPPCQGSCPSGHEIRGWLSIARGMDKPPVEGMAWQEYAFQRMVQANPFPATMGRVCPAPCEDGCNRNEVDDYVGINAVEQYVGDWANENNVKLQDPGADTGKKIAVIGGGPAGLSAAYFLRIDGHAVTIFEANEALGGMMRYGIPGYRTPRDMLDTEIDRVVEMGCEIKLNTRIGETIKISELEADFDAIFWAIGAQSGRDLPIEGWDETENCISGVEFLDAFNKGWVKGTAKNVVVVGGGDTSIDVASVARRLGHITHSNEKERPTDTAIDFTSHDVTGTLSRNGMNATLTSLFPVELMTAATHEREDALREGVDIIGSTMPLKVIKDDMGLAVALEVCDCTMEGMNPIPVAGTERQIEADIIISAIGQFGDFSGVEEFDNGKGFIDVDGFYAVKGHSKHFAGGDILRPHLLTTAIGQGRIAADTIGEFLDLKEPTKRPKVDVHHFNLLDELHQRGKYPQHNDDTPKRGTCDDQYAIHNYEDRSASQIIAHDELFKGHFNYIARSKRDEVHIDGNEVLGNFEERIIAFSEEQAQKEGERCMSCGMCLECDNCIIFCPQDAISKVKKSDYTVGRYVDTDYTKCIGCHICADVCPSGYIKMGLGD
ncbi:MAG: NAD(P)-binding protein [Hyphomicrobiales bacterium]|nr:NAD(P)-binding protein [Hyphomicrobiales bacterium]